MIAHAILIAHLSGVVSNARFTQPPAADVQKTDGGVSLAPFTFASADASFEVMWEDGDVDPTGRFYFYYLDHEPNFQVQAEDIETHATAIPGAPSDGIWTSCDCSPDAGVECPDLGFTRDCRNSFTWDTSGIPNGTYWLIAVNVDPPYFVYNASRSPVRIAHAGAAPWPASIFVLPDGFGAYSTTYRLRWLSLGTPPLTFSLSYGVADKDAVWATTTPLSSALTLTALADGTYTYDWDLSALANGVYFTRVEVTDGNGASSYTDSYFGLTVYHPPDGGVIPRDLGSSDGGEEMPKAKGCACDMTDDSVPLPALMLFALAGIYFRARTQKRTRA